MRLNRGLIALMLSAAALAAGTTGCAGSTLVYDPYWHDYHPWDLGESRWYQQWEIRTHRAHVDFEGRGPRERREYWDWRHR